MSAAARRRVTDSANIKLLSTVCHWQVKNPVEVSVDEVIVDKADQIPFVNNAVDELGSRRLFAVQACPLCLPQLEGLVLQMPTSFFRCRTEQQTSMGSTATCKRPTCEKPDMGTFQTRNDCWSTTVG